MKNKRKIIYYLFLIIYIPCALCSRCKIKSISKVKACSDTREKYRVVKYSLVVYNYKERGE